MMEMMELGRQDAYKTLGRFGADGNMAAETEELLEAYLRDEDKLEL